MRAVAQVVSPLIHIFRKAGVDVVCGDPDVMGEADGSNAGNVYYYTMPALLPCVVIQMILLLGDAPRCRQCLSHNVSPTPHLCMLLLDTLELSM